MFRLNSSDNFDDFSVLIISLPFPEISHLFRTEFLLFCFHITYYHPHIHPPFHIVYLYPPMGILIHESSLLRSHQVIAVHAYTQEGVSHDAVQKLEDVDNCLRKKEPRSYALCAQTALLFARLAGRHPRSLQLCSRLLERALKLCREHYNSSASTSAGDKNNAFNATANEHEAQVLCALGEVSLLQESGAQLNSTSGHNNSHSSSSSSTNVMVEKALQAFKDATKRDATNLRALLGLLHCQCLLGNVEEAEAQVELLSLMHNLDELGYETRFLQAWLLHLQRAPKEDYENMLRQCKEAYLLQVQQVPLPS